MEMPKIFPVFLIDYFNVLIMKNYQIFSSVLESLENTGNKKYNGWQKIW